jgi:hypothetical protein
VSSEDTMSIGGMRESGFGSCQLRGGRFGINHL